jgi:hypothetical protein
MSQNMWEVINLKSFRFRVSMTLSDSVKKEKQTIEQPNPSLSQFWNNLKEELKTIKNKEKGNKCNN